MQWRLSLEVAHSEDFVGRPQNMMRSKKRIEFIIHHPVIRVLN